MYNNLELEKDCIISIEKLVGRVLHDVEIDGWTLFFGMAKVYYARVAISCFKVRMRN